MTQLAKHHLLMRVHLLTQDIEQLPAHELQTAAITKANELMDAVERAVDALGLSRNV